MGQIFNRIKIYAKSQFRSIDNSYSSGKNFKEDEADFNKIIDELKRKKENKDSFRKNNPGSNTEKSDNTGNLTLEKSFEILGIPFGSSNDTIKSAYIQKIKEYHPDKVAALGSELKILAEKKTKEINLAFELINKKKGIK